MLDRSYKKVPQKNREISNSDILYIRKLVRIGSNARIPGDSHCEDKGYCSCFSKKIEMVKIAIPNFCINFLNKTVKSLSILYDFAVASLADAWIKIETPMQLLMHLPSHPSRMRGLKFSSVHICQLLISSHPSQMRGLKW